MSVTDHRSRSEITSRASAVLRPWVVFFAAVALAWVGLFALAGSHDELHADMTVRGHALIFAMWALMSVAMMAPTAVPLLKAYRDLVDRPHIDWQHTGFAAIAAGYCSAWIGFSVVAATLQHGLAHAGAISDSGASTSPWLSVGLLGGAGVYQFSSVKASCLSECRSPMAFFLASWRPGPRGAYVMGLSHGVVCIGCCWALMLVALVGGAMNLAWMGAATVLMIVEKLNVGRMVTRPIGVMLLAAAGVVALRALF